TFSSTGRANARVLSKERDLLRRPLLGLLGHRRGREEERERREVGDEGIAECRLMERRRRVKDREDDEPVRGLAWLAVDPRDGLPDEELSHRMAAQRDDDPRSKDLEMPATPTNGFPWTSSWYPGASPRKKIPDSPEPSPGTAWRALRWRGHAMHARISSATRPSSACCTRGGLWSRGRPDRSLSREVNDV